MGTRARAVCIGASESERELDCSGIGMGGRTESGQEKWGMEIDHLQMLYDFLLWKAGWAREQPLGQDGSDRVHWGARDAAERSPSGRNATCIAAAWTARTATLSAAHWRASKLSQVGPILWKRLDGLGGLYEAVAMGIPGSQPGRVSRVLIVGLYQHGGIRLRGGIRQTDAFCHSATKSDQAT